MSAANAVATSGARAGLQHESVRDRRGVASARRIGARRSSDERAKNCWGHRPADRPASSESRPPSEAYRYNSNRFASLGAVVDRCQETPFRLALVTSILDDWICWTPCLGKIRATPHRRWRQVLPRRPWDVIREPCNASQSRMSQWSLCTLLLANGRPNLGDLSVDLLPKRKASRRARTVVSAPLYSQRRTI